MIQGRSSEVFPNVHRQNRSALPHINSRRLAQCIKYISTETVINLRDRAIIGMMVYAATSPTTIASLRMCDYYVQEEQYLIRINQRGSILARPPLVALMHEYLDAIRPADATSPLFITEDNRPITASDVREIIRRQGRRGGAQGDESI
jgi:site-specific recombinase XerC